MPGGAVDKGESLSTAAARELREELGVTVVVDCGLAVDWVSADSSNAPEIMRFPGEILSVYDGGTWDDDQIATNRLPCPARRCPHPCRPRPAGSGHRSHLYTRPRHPRTGRRALQLGSVGRRSARRRP
ncbi:NUDIX domain-containing protein [Streptomyces sp. NPDC059153]|uniref:NUDIX domain-containing protein n=1 Tax=Streptomyces sp. NPDC059153 TaxID=3346743 RepID=UPI0036B62F7D